MGLPVGQLYPLCPIGPVAAAGSSMGSPGSQSGKAHESATPNPSYAVVGPGAAAEARAGGMVC
jgi:hypothetical protein